MEEKRANRLATEKSPYLLQHAYNPVNWYAYKLWDHYYSKETITQLMKENGYHVQNVWSDLTGKNYEENTKCLGVVVKK